MKNLNKRTDGYFEIMENGEFISSVYGKLTKNGEPKICKCCGRKVTSYFDIEYYDENDDGHFATYGVECFKQIATFDDSVFAL